MNTKAFFPCWEGSNLILGMGKENQIFLIRTPAAFNFFHQILTTPTPPSPPHHPPTPPHSITQFQWIQTRIVQDNH